MKKYLFALVGGLFIAFSTNVQAQNRLVPTSQSQAMLSYAPVVKKASPAVVNIYTSKTVRVRTSPFRGDPFFEQFFGGSGLFGGNFGRPRDKIVNSLGSGIIVDPSGVIITNHHVIRDSDEIKIVLSDRREFDARIVLEDKRTDLAILRVDTRGEELPFIEFEKADNLEVGDIVLAIGNPFGMGQTVTSGIVSALARTTVGISDFEFFIQTDAAINPGNSGGALVNLRGKLVGLNTAIYTKTGGSNGIGFATPSNMVQVVLNSYKTGMSKVVRPWFGASTQNLDVELAESLGLRLPEGVLIKNIYPESPADDAGLRTGDVVVTVDNIKVKDSESMKFRIATHNIGEKVNFGIIRNGEEFNIPVKMEPPSAIPPRNDTLLKGQHPISGATVANLSPALAEELGINNYKGIIVLEVQAHDTARRFTKPGDIIISVNGEEPRSIGHLEEMLEEPRRSWRIQALRGNRVISISIN